MNAASDSCQNHPKSPHIQVRAERLIYLSVGSVLIATLSRLFTNTWATNKHRARNSVSASGF